MKTGILILILIVVVLAVALGLYLAQQSRSRRLQQRFGPEYERTVARAGDQRSAETELTARERRRQELDIRELEPAARERYRDAWLATQGKFVDDPTTATAEADGLVAQVMRDRGYPVGDDFEQQVADVSVDHPQVAENYRAAHAVYQADRRGLATTDDLRQAFVHYRSLFTQLLDLEERRPQGGPR